MGELRVTLSLQNALDHIVRLLRADEATNFIASEFLISPELRGALAAPDGKFGRALTLGEASINREGFDWWQPPRPLNQIIEILRAAVQRAADDSEARALILAVLTEQDPAIIRQVRVD